jgi:hypothetical protein
VTDTTLDITDMLSMFATAYARPEPTPKDISVWHCALAGWTGDELREAAYVLLLDRSHVPAPADVLRVLREQRARLPPKPTPSVTGSIPLADGARQILEQLEERARTSGRPIPARRGAK